MIDSGTHERINSIQKEIVNIAKRKIAALEEMFPEAVHMIKLILAARAMIRIKITAVHALTEKGILTPLDEHVVLKPLQRVMVDLHHVRDTFSMHRVVGHSLALHVFGGTCFACCAPKSATHSLNNAQQAAAGMLQDGTSSLLNEDGTPTVAPLSPRHMDQVAIGDASLVGSVVLLEEKDLNLEAKPFARGGSGQVFKGQFKGKPIAAKQVFSAMDNTGKASEESEEFDREVGMLSKLTHPNVLKLYGVSHNDEGSIFIVMEFCAGE